MDSSPASHESSTRKGRRRKERSPEESSPGSPGSKRARSPLTPGTRKLSQSSNESLNGDHPSFSPTPSSSTSGRRRKERSPEESSPGSPESNKVRIPLPPRTRKLSQSSNESLNGDHLSSPATPSSSTSGRRRKERSPQGSSPRSPENQKALIPLKPVTRKLSHSSNESRNGDHHSSHSTSFSASPSGRRKKGRTKETHPSSPISHDHAAVPAPAPAPVPQEFENSFTPRDSLILSEEKLSRDSSMSGDGPSSSGPLQQFILPTIFSNNNSDNDDFSPSHKPGKDLSSPKRGNKVTFDSHPSFESVIYGDRGSAVMAYAYDTPAFSVPVNGVVKVLKHNWYANTLLVVNQQGHSATIPAVAIKQKGEISRGITTRSFIPPTKLSPREYALRHPMQPVPADAIVSIVKEDAVFFEVIVAAKMRARIPKNYVEVSEVPDIFDSLYVKRLAQADEILLPYDPRYPAGGGVLAKWLFWSAKNKEESLLKEKGEKEKTKGGTKSPGHPTARETITSASAASSSSAKPQKSKLARSPTFVGDWDVSDDWVRNAAEQKPYFGLRKAPKIASRWGYYLFLWNTLLSFGLGIIGLYFGLGCGGNCAPKPIIHLYLHKRHYVSIIIAFMVGGIIPLPLICSPFLRGLLSDPSYPGVFVLIFSFCSSMMYFSYITWVVGLLFFIISICYLFARFEICGKRETLLEHPTTRDTHLKYYTNAREWWYVAVNYGGLMQFIGFALLLGLNGAVCYFAYVKNYQRTLEYVQQIDAAEECFVFYKVPFADNCSPFARKYVAYRPLAAACGQCVNLNIGLLLLLAIPYVNKRMQILRVVLPRRLAFLFSGVRINNSLFLYKVLSICIFWFSSFHVFFHVLGHTFSIPADVEMNLIAFFGPGFSDHNILLWVTGLILLTMLVVIVGLLFGGIKKYSYKVYDSGHMAFGFLFILVLSFHANYFFLFGPLLFAIYFLEKKYRQRLIDNFRVKLVEVNYNEPYLELDFEVPWEFEEGQSIGLTLFKANESASYNFPIASKKVEGRCSVFIRTRPGAWSQRVLDLTSSLVSEGVKRGVTKPVCRGGNNRFNFWRRDPATGSDVVGLDLSGAANILQIVGPYRSLLERHKDYRDLVFVAEGESITHMLSILEYTTNRYADENVAYDRQVYFFWLVDQANAEMYQAFADKLSSIELGMSGYPKYSFVNPTSDKPCNFEIHVCVRPSVGVVSATVIEDEISNTWFDVHAKGTKTWLRGKWVRRPYEGSSLIKIMEASPTCADAFHIATAERAQEKIGTIGNHYGHTYVWSGIPDWSDVFKHVSERNGIMPSTFGVFHNVQPSIALNISRAAKCSSKICRFDVYHGDY